MAQKKIWFKAKKYGWGWYPSTWEGWLVLGAFLFYHLLLVLLINQSFDGRAGITSFLFLSLLGVIVLIAICYKFGEEPRWRWGK